MNKKSWRNIFELNQIVQVVGIVIAMSLAWNTVKVAQKNYGLQQQVDKLANEIAILELQNQQLKYNIEYFETDEYLELAAREKFNKKAPGEHVVALSRDDPVDTLEESVVNGSKVKPVYQENLDQWFYFLFGWEPQ